MHSAAAWANEHQDGAVVGIGGGSGPPFMPIPMPTVSTVDKRAHRARGCPSATRPPNPRTAPSGARSQTPPRHRPPAPNLLRSAPSTIADIARNLVAGPVPLDGVAVPRRNVPLPAGSPCLAHPEGLGPRAVGRSAYERFRSLYHLSDLIYQK